MRTRLVIGGVGLAMAAFGALRLLQLQLAGLGDALVWLAAGVAIHDGVVAPLTIGLTLAATRVVPARLRGRLTVALVVLATVTVTAIPVLGRFGERPDNATLLPRNYGAGWLVLAALVLACSLLAGPVDRWRRRRGVARRPEGPPGTISG